MAEGVQCSVMRKEVGGSVGCRGGDAMPKGVDAHMLCHGGDGCGQAGHGSGVRWMRDRSERGRKR